MYPYVPLLNSYASFMLYRTINLRVSPHFEVSENGPNMVFNLLEITDTAALTRVSDVCLCVQ